MNFYDNQDKAKRVTGSLLFYLFLGTAGIVGIMVLLAEIILSTIERFMSLGPDAPTQLDGRTHILLWTAVITTACILLASLWKTASLKRGGGERLARSLGGRMIQPNSKDPVERRLLNVVDEIAIASQTPRPLIYLLDREQGVNAFAAGLFEHQAVLGITRGAAELLTRDALQALVAHEFSHICNGDMRLNLKLIGHVHGIHFLTLTGYSLALVSSSPFDDSEGGGFVPGMILGAILAVIGAIGSLCANLIKAAVGRQREFLADAAAVQFTRNPQALVEVLLTAGGCRRGSMLATPKAPQASHLFFAQGVSTWFTRLFATHPSLAERIERIDPFYSGPLPHEADIDEQALRAMVLEQSRAEGAGAAAFAGSAPGGDEPEAVRQCRRHTRRLLDGAPQPVLNAARSSREAGELLFALLLSHSRGKDRQALADVLLERRDVRSHDKARELAALLDDSERNAWLPLIDLAMLSLQGMDLQERTSLRETVDAMMRANRRIDLFEWMLGTILNRWLAAERTEQEPCLEDLLEGAGEQPPPLAEEREAARKRIASKTADCALLLYALSHWGLKDEKESAACFARGARALGLELSPPAREDATLRSVETALKALSSLPALSREYLLTAAAEAVPLHRGVPRSQAELLRAASDILECPMPPLLPGLVFFELEPDK